MVQQWVIQKCLSKCKMTPELVSVAQGRKAVGVAWGTLRWQCVARVAKSDRNLGEAVLIFLLRIAESVM